MSYFELKNTDSTVKFPKRFKSYKYFTTFIHDTSNNKYDKIIFSDNKNKLYLVLSQKIYTKDFSKNKVIEFNLPKYIQNQLKDADIR